MNPTQSLQELQRQKTILENQIKNCPHEYNEAKFDPETKTEFTYRTVARGSDVYQEPDASFERKIDRWSRECKKCGFKQYTYEKAPVIERYEPKFT